MCKLVLRLVANLSRCRFFYEKTQLVTYIFFKYEILRKIRARAAERVNFRGHFDQYVGLTIKKLLLKSPIFYYVIKLFYQIKILKMK